MTDISTRSEALFGLWFRVNELAAAEDDDTIRKLLAESGIVGEMHVGTAPEDFTPDMVAEWVLGQWASILNGDPDKLWILNSARNISMHQYEKVTGEHPEYAWSEHGAGWHVGEISKVIDSMAKRNGGGDGQP